MKRCTQLKIICSHSYPRCALTTAINRLSTKYLWRIHDHQALNSTRMCAVSGTSLYLCRIIFNGIVRSNVNPQSYLGLLLRFRLCKHSRASKAAIPEERCCVVDLSWLFARVDTHILTDCASHGMSLTSQQDIMRSVLCAVSSFK